MIINPIIDIKKENRTRSSDAYSQLFSERIIFVFGEINDEMSGSVISQLLLLDSLNHKDIYLYLNSPGGSVSAGLSIADTMNFIQSDVCVVAIGFVASIAAVILASGAKGKRYCLKNADIMIHQPSTSCSGTTTSITTASKRILNISDRVYNLLSETTGKDKKTIEIDCLNDFYMTSQEAIDYGIVDKIIEKRKEE